MRKLFIYALITLIIYSCRKAPVEKGFISDEIRLKGADTIDVPMGIRTNTDVAWLDGSSEPVEFYIENIRTADGTRSEQFFQELPFRSWVKPYDYLKDTTVDLVLDKITEQKSPPVIINKTNGSLYFLETTSTLSNPGDVFHVDVRVKNSKGERLIKDYAKIRLSQSGKDFEINMATTAILLVNGGGETTFTLYDDIQAASAPARIQNIYDNNGKELFQITRVADTPYVGVKLLIQFKDAEGRIYDSKDYDIYSTTTDSYFKLGLNRQNTAEGAVVEFPMTPWPVSSGFLTTFEKSGTYDYNILDTATLRREVYNEGKYASLNPWPEPSWGAIKWYARLRSQVKILKAGSYKISVTFPATHLDGTF